MVFVELIQANLENIVIGTIGSLLATFIIGIVTFIRKRKKNLHSDKSYSDISGILSRKATEMRDEIEIINAPYAAVGTTLATIAKQSLSQNTPPPTNSPKYIRPSDPAKATLFTQRGGDIDNRIVGRWVKFYDTKPSEDRYIYEFNKNGTGKLISIYGEVELRCQTDSTSGALHLSIFVEGKDYGTREVTIQADRMIWRSEHWKTFGAETLYKEKDGELAREMNSLRMKQSQTKRYSFLAGIDRQIVGSWSRLDGNGKTYGVRYLFNVDNTGTLTTPWSNISFTWSADSTLKAMRYNEGEGLGEISANYKITGNRLIITITNKFGDNHDWVLIRD